MRRNLRWRLPAPLRGLGTRDRGIEPAVVESGPAARMDAWLDELAKWARPGMHVKRWLLLLLAALTFSALGIAFFLVELYRTQPFPEFVWYLTLQWVPRVVRGVLFLVVGAGLIGAAIYQLSKSLLSAVQPPYSQGRLVDLVYNYRLPQRRPTVVAFVGSRGFAALQAHRELYAERLVALMSVAEGPPPSPRSKFNVQSSASDVERGPLSTNFSVEPGTLNFGTWAESVLVPTHEPLELCAELEHGTLVRGAAAIRARRGGVPIKRVFLIPAGQDPQAVLGDDSPFVRRVPAHAHSPVLEVVREADAILFGPGSFYLNIIPNLLLSELSEALQASRARKIFVCNLMTEPGQTDDFSVGDFIRAIHAYGGFRLDYALVNTTRTDRTLQARYAAALAAPVEAAPDSHDVSVVSVDRRLQKLATAEGVVLVGADLATAMVERLPARAVASGGADTSGAEASMAGTQPLTVLRHDPQKLGVALGRLLGVN